MLEFVGGTFFMLVLVVITVAISDVINHWPDDF